jgi:hypothetical protein
MNERGHTQKVCSFFMPIRQGRAIQLEYGRKLKLKRIKWH